MTKKNRDKDATVKVTLTAPKYVFKAIKSYGDPYEEEIHSTFVKPGDSHEKVMAEGISQYSSDTETLRLPYHETWQLLKDGEVVLSFSRADLESKDGLWNFYQMIKTHSCLTFEIRNDY
jgi:hypothetical protein